MVECDVFSEQILGKLLHTLSPCAVLDVIIREDMNDVKKCQQEYTTDYCPQDLSFNTVQFENEAIIFIDIIMVDNKIKANLIKIKKKISVQFLPH